MKRKIEVEAIANGTVLDHLPPNITIKVAETLFEDDDHILIGVNFSSASSSKKKGVIKIKGKELGQKSLSQLALMAPEASINIIRDYEVFSKQRIKLPESFIGIGKCPNSNCITNHEEAETRFDIIKKSPLIVECCYCERRVDSQDITLS